MAIGDDPGIDAGVRLFTRRRLSYVEEAVITYVPQQGDVRIRVPVAGRWAFGIPYSQAPTVVYYVAGDGTVSVAPADVSRFMQCVAGCTLA
jgi:hypothetical protein